jgi:hypothetical protein
MRYTGVVRQTGTPMGIERSRRRKPAAPFTEAGPVTVTRLDGTVEELPALSPVDLRLVVESGVRRKQRRSRR